jgi:hypothetical protein
MSLRTSNFIILIILLTSLDVAAQTPQPSPKAEGREVSKSRSITGKVVNESGQPLSSAYVSVVTVGSVRRENTTVSRRDGTFRVDGLEPGPYFVAASLGAYTPPPREPENAPRSQYRPGDSVKLVLIKGGVITGTVTAPNGEPVVSIGVVAQMVRDRNGRRIVTAPTVREGGTDDRGVYRIYGLPAGIYVVAAGSINDHSQTGVHAFLHDVPTYSPSSTRDTAAEITVRAGEEANNVDIRYRAERGRTISGTVLDSAGEAFSFAAILISITPDGQRWNTPQRDSRAFAFDAISDGDYYLIGISHLKEGERWLSESKLINVRGADIGGIELTTQPLGYIKGRVVLEESKAPECTDKNPPPFTEMSVSAWHRDTEANKSKPQFVWSLGAPATPDAHGNFRLRTLVPSQYYFQARVSAKNWYLHSITFPATQKAAPAAKPTDATRVWTNVKSGDQLSGLTVTLAPGAASLSGKLVLAEGETPPENVFVFLVPVEAERAHDSLRFYGAPVSKEGKIALNNLAPGRYWLLTQLVTDDTRSPLTKVRLPDETRTRASLRREAEAGKTEIEFKPCQHVIDFEVLRK